MSLSLKRQTGTRIVLIYLIALLLVIGIGILAIVQLNQISATVNNLTNDLAVDRALSKDIISQVLLTRFYAHQYVRSQKQVDLDRFNEEFARLEELLALADRQITNPEREQMLNRIDLAIHAYGETFDEVTNLVQKRQSIYADVLDIKGQAIENELTALRIHVVFLNDPPVFLAFDNAQNAFRLMDLNTSKYLEAGDERYAVLFEMGYRQALAALSSLETTLQDPAQRQNSTDVKSAADAYYQGFQTIHTDYVRLKELLNTMLDVLEPEISHTASEIAAGIDREFKTQNKSSQALIFQTRLVLLITTTIAILAGLGLGIVLSRYLTERLQAEEVLRQSEERYRTLFERTPVGLYRSTPSGQIIDANPAFVQMLNYPNRETLLAVNAPDLYVDTEKRHRWQTSMETEGIIRNFEVQLRRYDGTIILARNNARVVRDSEDKPLYYEGSLEDITEQVQAEEELKRYRDHLEGLVEERTLELMKINQQLRQEITERMRTEEALEKAKKAAEQANQAKSIFLANMSHELRTPLNAILGFAQLMSYSPTLSSEHQDNLGIITTSGQHLLTLINQILDLSKIEAGRTTLDKSDFDLHRLLDDLEGMFRLRAENKGLRLIFDRTPGVPRYIHTDEIKLRQVLINLLDNALKFTETGRVSLRVSELGEFLSHSEGTHKTLHFEVKDTGFGIAPTEMDKLFKAFAQTETGRQTQAGTGLGLPISRKFVQLMGGDIDVESELGQGTTFKFDIQIEPADSIEALKLKTHNRVIALEPGQPRYRILVVDDHRDNRQLLIKLLSNISSPTAGFELREAENGQQAIEIWEAWQPHLIWMDMRMPVLNGYEATRIIKSKQSKIQNLKSKIIALTASSFEEDRVVILAAGCDDFLRKPFQEADIFELMYRHIGVRYVYKDSVDSPQQLAVSEKSKIQNLKSEIVVLPSELLENLEQAATRLDMEMIDSLIDEVRTYDATLAGTLAALADSFEYERILILAQEAIAQ